MSDTHFKFNDTEDEIASQLCKKTSRVSWLKGKLYYAIVICVNILCFVSYFSYTTREQKRSDIFCSIAPGTNYASLQKICNVSCPPVATKYFTTGTFLFIMHWLVLFEEKTSWDWNLFKCAYNGAASHLINLLTRLTWRCYNHFRVHAIE